MAKPRIQIYADLPKDLHEADAVMQRYGVWCVSSTRGKGSCGSVEGRYRAPGGEALEARRLPIDSMSNEQALRVQRALHAIDDVHRGLLVVLYVPRRDPVEAQLRVLRIPPKLSQLRHIEGLRRFWPRYQLIEKTALDKERELGLYNAPTSQLVSEPGA